MLTTTIPAYLYQQYADDDDLQAFITAYNAATQTYVDWFNSVGLPYYPGLSGALLDWVANGLYGMQRPTFESIAVPAVGTLNTELVNSALINSFTAPASATYYTLSDDVFQRILTWNLYKADGKRFCMRWLKRRVMRFLLGANGIDPVPGSTGFVIGAENTQAVSAGIAAGICTVTISEETLASFVTLPAGLVGLFQLIFQGGVLELPAQYVYECTLI